MRAAKRRTVVFDDQESKGAGLERLHVGNAGVAAVGGPKPGDRRRVAAPEGSAAQEKAQVWYNLDEASAICAAGYARWSNGARIYRLGAVAELLLNTGMRLGDALSLQWDRDVDFEKRRIHVAHSTAHVRDYAEDAPTRYTCTEGAPKTEAADRFIKLIGPAYHALMDLHEVTGATPYVLATEAGTPMRERSMDRMLEAIGKRAGIPDARGERT